ncbi:CGNR zinc finger domain-containing protein [Pantoea sp. ACRSH]|uniref:CGNR zinc finger domain-containing protein n=1 Tax=unclassified Pantoea TaxID=2630326 RepID=UPI001EF4E1C7|nr:MULTISPECIES: ABATE domain-containing protein [unclassified Pantoea]MCG7367705.1 CGNR zinc finger domain-containing protein [Pantoea sp. ACRSH]MCG7398905.1 CGNR zinc finger domain-containing protein [Pantoea sp. ACRSC]
MKARESRSAAAAPLQIGDHMALDFLNTVAQVDGEPHDFFQRDEDVARWLEAAGCGSGAAEREARAGGLLTAARELRAIILHAVQRRKREEEWQPEQLNRFLRSASSYLELALNFDGQPEYRRLYAAATPEQQLAPVAEQAADLLVNGDFSLVRECEHPDCTLWFYDRTKAHRRRWCSMALCGNRAKAARFRQMTQS